MPSHILSYHTPCRLLLALFAVPFVAKRKGESTTTAFADSYYADRGDVTVTARKARKHLGEGERLRAMRAEPERKEGRKEGRRIEKAKKSGKIGTTTTTGESFHCILWRGKAFHPLELHRTLKIWIRDSRFFQAKVKVVKGSENGFFRLIF